MAKPLTRANLDFFSERIRRIGAHERPRWGRLDAVTLMAHLRRAMEISTGDFKLDDIDVRPVPRGLRWLIIHVLPWPRGIKAPAEFTPLPAKDLDHERQATLAAMINFVEVLEREPERMVHSPAFGPLKLRQWAHVNGKHLEHHLRQFRV